MKSDEIRKYQLSQLELMDYVDSVCSEIGINYYLIGGTLLGAVRHGGFIPWDADIDIAMRRDDYEKFRLYCKSNLPDRYFYQHYTTEKNHILPHAVFRIVNTRVVRITRKSVYRPQHEGIYLDIFPLDTPPSSHKLQERQMKKIAGIKRRVVWKAAYTYSDTGLIKRIVKKAVQLCLLPISFKALNQKMDKTMQMYSAEDSGYLVSMASHYSYRKQLMPQDIYGTPVRVEYEGRQYLAPAKTHEYLTRIYGDYMQLPPEENRYSELDGIEYIDYGE